MDNLNTSQSTIKCFLESDHAYQSISDTEKRFLFEYPIVAHPGNSILIQLTDFEIPWCWYSINSSNNTFTYSPYSITQGGPQHNLITIAEGNYSATELAETLTTLMQDIDVSYDKKTNKFTFLKTAGTLPWTMTNNGKFFDLVGLNDVLFVTVHGNEQSTISAVNGQIISDKLVNLLGDPNIYVQIGLNLSSIDSHGNDSHILAKIPINSNNPYDIIHYKNESGVKMMITDKHIELLTIRLTDHNNNPIGNNQLNGCDFSMTIAFFFIEDRFKHDLVNAPETSDQVYNRINKILSKKK